MDLGSCEFGCGFVRACLSRFMSCCLATLCIRSSPVVASAAVTMSYGVAKPVSDYLAVRARGTEAHPPDAGRTASKHKHREQSTMLVYVMFCTNAVVDYAKNDANSCFCAPPPNPSHTNVVF